MSHNLQGSREWMREWTLESKLQNKNMKKRRQKSATPPKKVRIHTNMYGTTGIYNVHIFLYDVRVLLCHQIRV